MATLAQILALLPDNTTGDIGADDVRAAVTALWHRTDGTDPVEGIQFDITYPLPAVYTAGHMYYNATSRTLDLMTGIEGNILQVGQEQYLDGLNNSGVMIANGSPILITGGMDEVPTIGLDNGGGLLVGVATVDIPDGEVGRVTTYGLVHGLNTSAFSDGETVYSTPIGGLSGSVSSSRVGFVTNADATEGVLMVLPDRRVSGSGSTAGRPATFIITGYMYFDTDLGFPVWWDGDSAWVDAAGNPA